MFRCGTAHQVAARQIKLYTLQSKQSGAVCNFNILVQTETKNSALTFYNLGGAFILLATGGVVAMAAVIIELAYHSRKNLKKVFIFL